MRKFNFDKQLKNLVAYAKYYSDDGFKTPTDAIDIEVLLKNNKHHLFVIQYCDDDNIKCLFKQPGSGFQDCLESALKHFKELEKANLLNKVPSTEELEAFEKTRKSTIDKRKEIKQILPIKVSGSVIYDDTVDLIGDLIDT